MALILYRHRVKAPLCSGDDMIVDILQFHIIYLLLSTALQIDLKFL